MRWTGGSKSNWCGGKGRRRSVGRSGGGKNQKPQPLERRLGDPRCGMRPLAAACFSRSLRLGAFLEGFFHALKLERQMSVDEGCAAVGLDQLAGNPSSFWRANESDGIADIRRSAEAAHGRPAAFLPFTQASLEGFGQTV